MMNDLELPELVNYLPSRDEAEEFDLFWADNLAAAGQWPISAEFRPVDTLLKTVDSFDVSFTGYGGQAVRGWLNIPRAAGQPLPCMIEYLGYGGGHGLPQDRLLYSAAGYAHLVMDTRGQGGDTPDLATTGAPHVPGFTTLGITSPREYYYLRLYIDAVRAVEAARSCELVDPDRVGVVGKSQGGGVAIAVAGLADRLWAVLPGVPFMCHIRRAIRLAETNPYAEIARYLRANPRNIDEAMRTLSYFDGINFAARASAPALFSVALMDKICPPSTVFAAYNHYAGPKELRIWEFNEHDGALLQHGFEQLQFLAQLT